MKFTSIHSTDLPDIPDTVKECVNQGQWLLFKASEADVGVQFYLKTSKDIFALNENGQILPSTPVSKTMDMDELYYFSDINKPVSLSNAINLSY